MGITLTVRDYIRGKARSSARHTRTAQRQTAWAQGHSDARGGGFLRSMGVLLVVGCGVAVGGTHAQPRVASWRCGCHPASVATHGCSGCQPFRRVSDAAGGGSVAVDDAAVMVVPCASEAGDCTGSIGHDKKHGQRCRRTNIHWWRQRRGRRQRGGGSATAASALSNPPPKRKKL